MPFDIGLLDFAGKLPFNIAAAQRQIVEPVRSAIPADPSTPPPEGAFRDCALGDLAYREASNAEIAALPAAHRPARLAQNQALRETRRVVLTTQAGRAKKVRELRACIARRPAFLLDFHANKVLFAIGIGQLRLRTAPMRGLQAVPSALALRERFLKAFEVGWTLTDLQADLQTTFRGHFGQTQPTAEEVRADTVRLQAEKAALQQGAAGAPQRAARPKAPARPKPRAKAPARPKAAAKAKAKQPGPRRQGDENALPARPPARAPPKAAALPVARPGAAQARVPRPHQRGQGDVNAVPPANPVLEGRNPSVHRAPVPVVHRARAAPAAPPVPPEARARPREQQHAAPRRKDPGR